jgi:hypothetical protein
MRSRCQAARRAVAVALVVLAAGIVSPIWTTYYLTRPKELSIVSVPLWEAIAQYPAARQMLGPPFWEKQRKNLAVACGLVIVAGGVGLGVYRVYRRADPAGVASDYQDGPGGSLADGRASTSRDAAEPGGAPGTAAASAKLDGASPSGPCR